MNKKRTFTSKSIDKVKQHIKHIFPYLKDIRIKMEKPDGNSFRSKIIVKAPNKKVIIATKDAENYNSALEKSEQAVIKQINKIQTRWEKKAHHKTEVLDLSA